MAFGYLVYNDYKVTIQDPIFQQWIASNDATRLQAELRSQAKITEYLVQKYDLKSEFQPTTVFNPLTSYQANALVQLNYAAWVSTTAYTVNQLVSFTDGNCYICILPATGNSQDPTHATYWTKIGTQFDLYNIPSPYPIFDFTNGVYNVGDIVFWKGKVYQCIQPTILPDHFSIIQSPTYASEPPANIFPDNKTNGVNAWGAGVAYSLTGLIMNAALPSAYNPATTYTAGQFALIGGQIWEALRTVTGVNPGTDIKSWQPVAWNLGDNRNQSIVDAYVAITLKILSPRISPRVTPVWLDAKYEAALSWLQMSAEGSITLDVPEVQPPSGGRIRYGGVPKQQNGY